MYTYKRAQPTSLNVNASYIGETIEQKINRVTNNREPIKDGAPIIYTDRTEGVKPEYNIRTDRFELAVDATDSINRGKLMKREERIQARLKKDDKGAGTGDGTTGNGTGAGTGLQPEGGA